MRHMFKDPKYTAREPRIDLLRFFLAWFVVFVHVVPWYDHCGLSPNNLLIIINKLIVKIFQTGYETNPAVLCFITLSGYCIHRNGVRVDSFNLQKFFLRRAFRILPMFIFGLLLGVITFMYFGGSEKIQAVTGTKNIEISGIFFKSLALHSFFPYKFSSVYQGNGPLITAGVECWLYATYPIAFYIIQKYGQRKFWCWLIFLTIVGAIAYQIKPSLSSWWHNGSLWGFLIYWYIGVAAVGEEFLPKKRIPTLIYAYMALTFFLIFVTSKISIFIELRKCIFSLLFAYFLSRIDRKTTGRSLSTLFEKATSNIFGSGYSIYAIHVPIIVFCITYEFPLLQCLLMVAFMSYGTFFAIETPFINLGREAMRKKKNSGIH